MPPRKKQKTSVKSKPTDSGLEVKGTPSAFPDPSLLSRALKQHQHALSLRSKENKKAPQELIELDAWLTNGETGLLAKVASSQSVNKTDMTSLMKWKLSRGKSRPTLLALIGSNPEALVLESTSAALQTVRKAKGDLNGALLALPDACKMKGVGAATASALLTLQSPHLLPFMSDEAASFFAGALGEIKYTDSFYKKFAAAMVDEVRRLNAQTSVSGGWDSMKLERALWTIVVLKKHGQDHVLNPSDDTVEDEPAALPSTSRSLKRSRDSS
ncbi:hypothetical protein B0H10DRAFT_2207160 [Mycena sp. CBHHK59/15]|nr:hypothetical protein B0H10DRAFT_2207160 [Mycena sp. CBHHK59/15]